MTLKAWTKSRGGARVLGAVTVVALIAGVEALIRAGVINRFIVPLPSQIALSFERVVLEEDVLGRFMLTAGEGLAAGVLLTIVGVAAGQEHDRYFAQGLTRAHAVEQAEPVSL